MALKISVGTSALTNAKGSPAWTWRFTPWNHSRLKVEFSLANDRCLARAFWNAASGRSWASVSDMGELCDQIGEGA